MKFPELQTEIRKIKGRHVRSVRDAGHIPCELYGEHEKNVSLQCNKKDFDKFVVAYGDASILQLMIDQKLENVIVQEIQRDPVSSDALHVDFMRIRMDKPVVMDVPLKFIGISPAVKEQGGVLVKNMLELEVECLPADLPKEFVVDISSLRKFDDIFTVGQIELPSGVTVTSGSEEVLAVVVAPRSEEELASLEEAVTEDVSAVEGVAPTEEEKAAEGEAGKKEEGSEEKKASGGEKKKEK